jgi:hypothetical protein
VNTDQLFTFALVFFFGGVMPLVLAYAIPAAKARARRLEGQTEPDPRMAEEIDSLRQRIGELEERLDFTERVLARQQESQRLPGGSD